MASDSSGNFLLTPPEPGAYRLQAERLGYRTAATPPVELEARDTLEVEYRLSTEVVVLQPMRVVAASRRPQGALGGFYDRMERGAFATFISRQRIEERHPVRASDLLRTVPGVQLVRTWGGRTAVLMPGGCVPQIVLDGMPARTRSIDDLVSPLDLEGIEIYRSAAATPAELTGPGGDCGVIALWMRRGP